MILKLKPLGYSFEDIEALALIGLWETTKNFDETKSKFTTYAYYRARGYVLDCVRKDYPLSRTAVDKGLRVATFSDSCGKTVSTFNVDAAVEQRNAQLMWHSTTDSSVSSTIEFVELAFSKLTKRELEVARLYFIYGLTITEIASKINRSVGNISQRLKRIRQLIHNTLIDELPEHSVLRTAFEDEASRNDHDRFTRHSPTWGRVQNRDRGIFSCICTEAGGTYAEVPHIQEQPDHVEEHAESVDELSESTT